MTTARKDKPVLASQKCYLQLYLSALKFHRVKKIHLFFCEVYIDRLQVVFQLFHGPGSYDNGGYAGFMEEPGNGYLGYCGSWEGGREGGREGDGRGGREGDG